MNKTTFDPDFTQRLKDANNIVDVIGKYITLTKKGKNYWACCPFHHEKTPSFSVSDTEQYFHCFGCGEKGDIFTFVQKYEGLDFVEAMIILCKYANIEMPTTVIDENARQLKEKRTKIYEANRLAAQHFHNNLKTQSGNLALKYLNSRHINSNSIIRFGLGYSKDWDDLVKFLKSKNISVQTMKDAGLIGVKDGHAYDIMAGRLIFPLINSYGDVVGFSARILTKEKFAKYRNTEQTVVFDKSKVIYGINLIKKQFQKTKIDYILLVEGQVDVISLHQAGFTTAVATLGTALTPLHAKELSRYSSNIVVCFDGDGAGQKATLRSLDILKDLFYIRVASIPNNQDPDEYIQQHGAIAFQKVLDEALPFIDYQIKTLSKNFNLNNNYEKSKFISQALQIVKELKSSTQQEIYVKLIADIAKVSIDNLNRELNNTTIKTNKAQQEEQFDNSDNQQNAYVEACRFIIYSLLNKKDYAYFFDGAEFLNSSLQKLYDNILKTHNNGKTFIISNVFNLFNVDEEPEINAILNYVSKIDSNKEKEYYNACVKIIHSANIDNKIQILKQQYDQEKNIQEKLKIATQLQVLAKEKIKRP